MATRCLDSQAAPRASAGELETFGMQVWEAARRVLKREHPGHWKRRAGRFPDRARKAGL